MCDELLETKISETKSNNQLPCIEFTSATTEISKNTYVSLLIRGETLEECRKHFDEIREGDV